MTAKSFGYGSASKLVTIARSRPSDERHFVGSGIALDFAQLNRDHFTSVTECDIEQGWPVVSPLADADALLSVRNAEAVFWARRVGVRSVFVDSLLWFWKPQHPLPELVDSVARLDRLPDGAAWTAFRALPEHDRAVLGHVLADASLAQRFPGVDERVAELNAVGAAQVRVCGPIVCQEELRSAAQDVPTSRETDGQSWDAVINVCGYDNFVLDSRSTPGYLQLIERWLGDHVERHSSCRRVLVCGGPYRHGRVTEVGGAMIQFTTLSQRHLLGVVARAPRYLCSPGLTSFHEMVALGRVPRMLPPQHSCHLALIRALETNGVERLALDLCDVLAGSDVPADDLVGTEAIIGQAAAVLRSPTAFRAMSCRLDELLELSTRQAEGVVSSELHRIHQLLAGPDALASVAAALATDATDASVSERQE